MDEPLHVEARGPVTILTLNRPESRNAMTGDLAHAIEDAVDVFEADDAQRVMVLTGAGGTFCAGMDLKAAQAGDRPWTDRRGGAGIHLAMELTLTGGLVDAPRLASFGLVNRVTEPGRALDAALALAEEIDANAPTAVRVTKQIVSAVAGATEDELWKLQDTIGLPLVDSEDAAEGMRAFAEKRDPVWTGR